MSSLLAKIAAKRAAAEKESAAREREGFPVSQAYTLVRNLNPRKSKDLIFVDAMEIFCDWLGPITGQKQIPEISWAAHDWLNGWQILTLARHLGITERQALWLILNDEKEKQK